MTQLQTFIDSTSTHQLLNSLNLSIDEVKLERTISVISNQINNIESASGPSYRTQYLRNELTGLEGQLSGIRNNVNLS